MNASLPSWAPSSATRASSRRIRCRPGDRVGRSHGDERHPDPLGHRPPWSRQRRLPHGEGPGRSRWSWQVERRADG